MTQLSGARLDRDDEQGKYHPHCGEAHSGKPAKAAIGLGLLLVCSFLLHEVNVRMPAAQPDISTDIH